MAGSNWEHVAWVQSHTNPAKRYEHKRRLTDGHIGCECEAYRFSRGTKTCKHLTESATAVFVPQAGGAVETATITVKAETFSVVRRIFIRNRQAPTVVAQPVRTAQFVDGWAAAAEEHNHWTRENLAPLVREYAALLRQKERS
jgi:hypothetical protein